MGKGLCVQGAYSCVGGEAGEGTAQLPGDSLWGAAAALFPLCSSEFCAPVNSVLCKTFQ